MNLSDGSRLGGVLLAVVAAVLAAYSTATTPLKLAHFMTRASGLGRTPAKVVLEQRAFSAGALLAIACSVAFQILAEFAIKRFEGMSVLLVAFALALLIVAFTLKQRRDFIQTWQQSSAREGGVHDIEQILAPTTPIDFIEGMGFFYDLRRKPNEDIERYRGRLIAHIRRLAE